MRQIHSMLWNDVWGTFNTELDEIAPSYMEASPTYRVMDDASSVRGALAILLAEAINDAP